MTARADAPRRAGDEPVPDDGLPVPRRRWAMLAIGLGTTMAVLDGSIVNLALPTLASDLGAAPSTTIRVVNAYQIAVVVSLLPLAALGERIGYARVYRAATVLFTASSLACALAPSLEALIVARAVQGLGGAGIMSVSAALIRYTYPRALLGRGIGVSALVVAVAAAVGPTLAAGLLAIGSWPWLFAVNVPFGVANAVLAWRVLPASDRSGRAFDWPSAALNAVALGLFFVGLESASRGDVPLAASLSTIALAGGAGWALHRRLRRAEAPLIPLDLLRGRTFALSIVASMCAFVAWALAFVSLPFHFETALGRSTVETGLLLTAWPVALGGVAPIAGRLSDRFPAGALGGLGMLVLAIGLVALIALPPDASNADILWRLALGGAGFGLFQTPNNRTMLSAAPQRRAGAASGMLATARLIGQTGGATLAGIVFALHPERAEPIGLGVAAGFALAAGAASVARRAAPGDGPGKGAVAADA